MVVPPIDRALPGLDALLVREPIGFGRGWRRATTAWQPGVEAILTFRHADSGAVARVDLTAAGERRSDPADDPALPGLRSVLAREPASRIVSYKPGSSCVIGHTDATLVKVFRPDAVDHVVARWSGIAAASGRRGAPRIPQVLEHRPEANAFVMDFLEGIPLTRFAYDVGVPEEDRLESVRALGRAMAALAAHEIRLPVRTLADDVREAAVGLDAMRAVDPRLADRVADVLGALGPDDAPPGPMVPSHGALRTDQVLVGSSPALVDLDDACWATPERDAANFAAYLWWRAIRRPVDAAMADGLQRALRVGLEAGGLPLDEQRWARQRAASLLKIATRRYRSLTTDEWPLVPQLVEEAAGAVGR